jgi:ribosomal protein S18 acetylase RimI-like enzyme
MREADIPFALAIQSESYPPTHIESEAVFRLRLESAPHTAWVAEDRGNIMAYLVAYPSLYGKISPLGAVFSIPTQPDCLYLHDLALSPKTRGRGLAGKLVRHSWQTAGRFGLKVSALVSVQGSHAFWSGLGYRISALVDPAQQSHLETYAGSGWYMARSLQRIAP